jgi:hypothetical protein
MFYAEHPEDRPIYESHIAYAFNHLTWRGAISPLLVISGGFTKIQRQCSESRSYLDLARALGLAIPISVALEEYALTSIENVLFSLYVYHQIRKVYPESLEVISWEFKRKLFEATLVAINNWAPLGQSWTSLNFFPVSDLWGTLKDKSLAVEDEYIASLKSGIYAYYQNPQTQAVLARRDVYASRDLARKFYEGYPMPFLKGGEKGSDTF